MTVRAISHEFSVERRTEKGQIAGSVRFDWIMLIPCFWLLGGGYLDAWAHNHVRLETFFTPWHAVLYSGLLAVLTFHVGALIRNHSKGYAWRDSIPDGYWLSLLGITGFVFGGIGDMIWHMLFGIELNIDGALSPTHLVLALCIGLIVAGPFRAAWKRSNGNTKPGFVQLLPMIISLAFTLSAITLISQMAHPFVFLWPSTASQQDPLSYQALAVISIVFQSIILMAFVLLAVRRWTLPFGTFTLVLTLNITLLSFMRDHYLLILVAAVAGFVTDVLVWRLKPSTARPDALRLFAFLVPTVLYLLYFLTLIFTTGIFWTIHLWLGSTVVAGIAGWLLSYILVPPQIPAGEQIEKRNNE
ncbi:MAG TPA: hypothetical protein VK140_12425 [Ktedonobacteraceae bacterium]|nr:hypothetical protein [Ktedonobacteraceae bacterium]